MATPPGRRPSFQSTPSSFRRSFTAPLPKLTPSPRPRHVDPSDAAADILYSHPSTLIVSFSPPGVDKTSTPASQDFDYPVDTIETLPWSAPREMVVAKGQLIIEKVPGSATFLKAGRVVNALLRNSQCWCVDGDSKFVLRVRKFQYNRIELPNATEEEKQKIEELKTVLRRSLRFEVTPCPFKRDFKVELPESERTPRKKKAWRPRQSMPSMSPLSIDSRDRTSSVASTARFSISDTASIDGSSSSRPVSRAESHVGDEIDLGSDGDADSDAEGSDSEGEAKTLVKSNSTTDSNEVPRQDVIPLSLIAESDSEFSGQALGKPTKTAFDQLTEEGVGDKGSLPTEIQRHSSSSEDPADNKDFKKVESVSPNIEPQEVEAEKQLVTGAAVLESADSMLDEANVENNSVDAEEEEPNGAQGTNDGQRTEEITESSATVDTHAMPESELNMSSSHSIPIPAKSQAEIAQASNAPSEDRVSSSPESFQSVGSFPSSSSFLPPGPQHLRQTPSILQDAAQSDYQTTRDVSQTTVRRRSSKDNISGPSTPRLVEDLETDEDWPDLETPAPPGSFVRQRKTFQRSGFSPLPPASTLLAPSPHSADRHVTTALVQKAASVALGKPIDAVIFFIHILGRIAQGATVSDLLSGELFKQSSNRPRSSSRRRDNDGPEAQEEDDYGHPIRGRSRDFVPDVNDNEWDLD